MSLFDSLFDKPVPANIPKGRRFHCGWEVFYDDLAKKTERWRALRGADEVVSSTERGLHERVEEFDEEKSERKMYA